jgi:hypothetical protein
VADPRPDANPGNPRAGADAGCPVDGVVAPCPDKPLPILEIVNRKTNLVVSGTNQTVIVGQKILLMVRTKPAEAMSDIKWIISGKKIKDYPLHTVQPPAGLDSAIPTDLEPADLQGVNLDFYWIKGGNETVQAAATVRGTRLTASVSYAVLAPTNLSMTSVTGRVEVSDPNMRHAPGLALHFGTFATNPKKPGISWTFKATAPAGGAGKLAATQLINPRRDITNNDDTPMSLNFGGDFVLDTTTPYKPAVDIAESAEATWKETDSPAMTLPSVIKAASANLHFKVYLMYRPAGEDSERIWVTVGLLEWFWQGKTTRTGDPAANHWTAPIDVDNSHNPVGAASWDLPRWSKNVTSLSWTTP